jgi:transglutaminase-like putative cysteine protease
MSGFTDNVELGEIGQIKKSSAVVMRIRVAGDPAQAESVRWRGIALTDFDGKRWYTPRPDPIIIDRNPDGTFQFGPEPLKPGDSRVLQYTVLLEPLATDALFFAARPVTVRGRFGPGMDRIGPSPQRYFLLLDKTGSVLNSDRGGAKLRYEAISNIPQIPPARLRAAGTEYPAAIRKTYLQLPSLDPRIAALAVQATAHAPTPYDKAANLERFFHTNYGYTLDLSGPPGKDPLSNFLFVRRAGHCEYFAASMTVMLRTLGIPARYVNGFLTGEFNDVAGDYIVRASDAHSWVEAYFPGYGWIPFDPTPPADEKPKNWFARLSFYWDWFQVTWSEWVINYDFRHQITVWQNVQRTSNDWSKRARHYYEVKRHDALVLLRHWQQRVSSSPYSLPGALVFLISLLIYVRGRAMGGYLSARWTLRFRREGKLPPALASIEYKLMLKLLERRGWRKSPSQTPLEFAAAIPAADLSAPVAQLTQIYQSARFGNYPPDARAMHSLLAFIKNSIRSSS